MYYWVVLLLHNSVLTLMSRRTQERICKIPDPISVRPPKHFPETCAFFREGLPKNFHHRENLAPCRQVCDRVTEAGRSREEGDLQEEGGLPLVGTLGPPAAYPGGKLEPELSGNPITGTAEWTRRVRIHCDSTPPFPHPITHTHTHTKEVDAHTIAQSRIQKHVPKQKQPHVRPGAQAHGHTQQPHGHAPELYTQAHARQ